MKIGLETPSRVDPSLAYGVDPNLAISIESQDLEWAFRFATHTRGSLRHTGERQSKDSGFFSKHRIDHVSWNVAFNDITLYLCRMTGAQLKRDAQAGVEIPQLFVGHVDLFYVVPIFL